MQKVGLIGSGFGIYGYLPALITLKKINIFIPLKYKSKIKNRNEVNINNKKIIFVKNLSTIYSTVDTIVIAKRPYDQLIIAKRLLKVNNIKNFYLEKPLARNPEESNKLLELFKQSDKKINIGYLFTYTKWWREIRKTKFKNLKINWSFKSIPMSKNINSWKLKDEKGGGIINFYGIHFISLLSLYRGTKIKSSKILKKKNGIYTKFQIYAENKNKKFSFNLNINSLRNSFEIVLNNKQFLKLSNPFAQEENSIDQRINCIIKMLESNKTNKKNINNYNWYFKTNELWKKVI